MKLKVCEYCGTEYNNDQSRCPLCGKDDQEAHAAASKSKTGGHEDRIPQWMWIMTCVLLALAVLVGLIYFLISMGYVGGKDNSTPAISVPVEEVVPVDPIVEEPEDLSCTELTLNQRLIIIDEPGRHVFLTALAAPLDCEDPIVFTSADETVATVDDGGMITAVAPGKTEILVSCGDILETCTVMCTFQAEVTEEENPEETEDPEETDEPEETEDSNAADTPEEEETAPALPPELSSVDFTLFQPGEETTLAVKNAREGAVITFASSDPTVVTVSDTGLVTAVSDGVADITVTVDGVSLTCIARCNLGLTTENNETPVMQQPTGGVYHLSHEDVTLAEGINESFILLLLDEGGNKVNGAVYSSSDSSVCTAESSGRITAIGAGMATVTVNYGGSSYTCIIR